MGWPGWSEAGRRWDVPPSALYLRQVSPQEPRAGASPLSSKVDQTRRGTEMACVCVCMVGGGGLPEDSKGPDTHCAGG